MLLIIVHLEDFENYFKENTIKIWKFQFKKLLDL